MSWYEDFELVTLPSIPRPGNIYRNEKCVVLSIEDYNKFIEEKINPLKEQGYTITEK